MYKLSLILLMALVTACASWKEAKAPCTYDNRSHCGELVYSGK